MASVPCKVLLFFFWLNFKVLKNNWIFKNLPWLTIYPTHVVYHMQFHSWIGFVTLICEYTSIKMLSAQDVGKFFSSTLPVLLGKDFHITRI